MKKEIEELKYDLNHISSVIRNHRFWRFLLRSVDIDHPKERILGIFERGDYFEVHFDDRVEFRALDGKLFGESKVYPIG